MILQNSPLAERAVQEDLAALRLTLFGLCVATALSVAIFCGGLTYEERLYNELRDNGIQTEGRVVAVDRREPSISFGYVSPTDGVYRVLEKGVDRDMSVGERVTVYIDSTDESNLTVEGEYPEPGWVTALMVASVIVFLLGLIMAPPLAFGIRMRRRILGSHTWRDAHLADYVAGARSKTTAELRVDGEEHEIYWWPRGKGRRLTIDEKTRQVQVAGTLPGYVVLRAPGRREIILARTSWFDRL